MFSIDFLHISIFNITYFRIFIYKVKEFNDNKLL